MKQSVNTSWFSVYLKGSLFLLISVLPQLLIAQESNDSTRIILDDLPTIPKSTLQLSLPDPFPEKATAYPMYPSMRPDQLPDFSLKNDIYLPYQTNPSKLFRGDYYTDGVLKQFSHGVLFGAGGQTSVPGIGRFNNATLGYQHAFSQKLTLEVQANAMKINMIHATGQAFSTSGTLIYRPSERVALKLFGSYDIGNSYGMNTHSYGGTISFDMSERFGMEFGVQRYYDEMRGRWETVPIVIPYYHFDNFTLGLDVGGIIYEILREVVFDKQKDNGPTIMPPRMQIPIR